MQLKTILNRVEPFKSFVYGKAKWVEGRGRPTLEVEVHARKNSRAICSGCGCPGPGYDRLPERRFEFVPLWGIPDLAFDPLGLSGRLAGGGRRRTPAAKLGPRGGQLPADLGTRVQDGFRQLLDDMELAELVGNLAEHPGNRLWIELRAVGRDAPQQQAAPLNRRLEGAEEPLDVGMVRVVVQHLIGEAAKGVVVHDRENAKRPVVQLVGRDVSREIIQRGVQVIAADALLRLFSPRTPPSSESWRMAQRRDGPARDANWPRGRATRLPPPDAPPWQRHGGCSGSWAEPSPTCPR